MALAPILLAKLWEVGLFGRASDVLKRCGRIHIPNCLFEEEAHALHGAIQALDWRLALNGTARAYDFKSADLAAFDLDQRRKLVGAVHAQAKQGFQFLFDCYRISDEYESGALTRGPLAELFAALNSEPVLESLRALTGDTRIAYLDAQATRYRAGHFLTQHDDDAAGKNRLFAYVLNLTPVWKADWGGLLMFIGPDGHVAEAYTPRWGALNILKVPQPHAVSMVTSFAGGPRFSITGWMRSARP